MNLQTLVDNFALPGILSFDEDHEGLVRARVTTPACNAELYLQGAHLTEWEPAGHGPVLFLSEKSEMMRGKAIRGGVPLIFPWFGPRTASANHPRTDGPAHGFARVEEWELAFAALSGDDLHLTLTLGPTQRSRDLGFDQFRLALHVILGATLTMRLTVVNDSESPMLFEEAFHTYLTVGDATQVQISGLAGTEFLDKTDSGARKLETGPTLTFNGETDRPYVNTVATVTLEDPALRRRITVAKQGSATTVIWNPWIVRSAAMPDMADDGWRQMACIETANAGENAVELQPQSTHTMEARIEVETL